MCQRKLENLQDNLCEYQSLVSTIQYLTKNIAIIYGSVTGGQTYKYNQKLEGSLVAKFLNGIVF